MTIGGDFEFEIYDTILENVIDAYLIIKNKKGEIGLDGFTSIGEIRPIYDFTANRFFNNIIDSLSKLKKKINTLFLYPTFDSINYPTGFHIHFGLPPHVISTDVATFLSSIYYETVYKYNSQRRKESLYSKRENYRLKPYGFEYRECPSIVLNEPEYFRIFLNSIFKLVEKYINGKKISIPKNSEGIIDVNDENNIKQTFDFNDYELTIFKEFVSKNYENLKNTISPLVVKFVIGRLSGNYKGRWNRLKIYMIENMIEKFVDDDSVRNGLVIVKTLEINKKPRIDRNKKINLYLDKDLAESELTFWETDQAKWERFLESVQKLSILKVDTNLVYQFVKSFY